MLGGAVKCGFCLNVFSSAGPDASYEQNTTTCSAVTVPNLHVRIGELESVLSALVKHWRAGEPVHEMEDLMDHAEAALRKRNCGAESEPVGRRR